MRKLYLLQTLFVLTFGNGQILKAQISFTKITVGSVVTDSSDCIDASWADYDKDGDLDLFVTTNFPSQTNPTGRNLLFQNNCNGEFTRVLAIPGGLTNEGNSLVCTWIDYDNDGNTDLYVGNYNPMQSNYLYRNKGDYTFEKITDIAITQDGKRTDGIAWLDYDNDGHVDLFISNTADRNNLYHNNGDGTFTLITAGDIVNDQNIFSGVSSADFDNDGDIDLYVTTKWSFNYRNYLYINNGNGTFTKDENNIIVSDPRMSNWSLGVNYSSAWTDYDNDLNLDLFVTSVYGGNYLYHNNGDGTFTSIDSGPVVSTTGVNNGGACWGDYDNDGDLDLYVSNFQKNYFYINNGDGTFTLDNQEIIGNDTTVESYGASWADYDNDGDLDLFVPNAFGSPDNFLYLNIYSNNGNQNNWFKATLKGVISNSSAVGARIYVKANNFWQMREINASSAYTGGGGGAVSGLATHFGIGNATIIDSLKVVWPASGITQIFTNVPANKFVQIAENENIYNEVQKCKADLPLKNPRIISGILYHDMNDNCYYDSIYDFPIANRLISLIEGYHVLTNNVGYFEFQLPEGRYSININELENDIWKYECTDTLFLFDLISRNNIDSFNIPIKNITAQLCGRLVNVDIIPDPPPVNPTQPCYPLPLTSPCPNNPFGYCVIFTNLPASGLPITAGSVFNITVDNAMQITSVASSAPINFVGLGTNAINGTFTNAIGIGNFVEICLTVDVLGTAFAPFNTSATLNIGGNVPFQFVVNGDFQNGNTGFGTDYFFNQACATRTYFIGANPFPTLQNPNAICDNWFHSGWDHTFGNNQGRYLYADGSMNTNNVVWRQTISGLSVGLTYNFRFWANNIYRILWNEDDPSLQVRINTVPFITTPNIPETPDVWLTFAGNWVATATTANIDIRSLSSASIGNDFGIDDISFIGICNANVTDIEQELESCSCDPNDKLVAPKGCGVYGNLDFDTPLEYIIRFENTGVGAAHNIVIRDVLDSNLDINSFELLGASHPVSIIQFFPNNVIFITFEGIELPPFTTSPENNKGYIKFRIKPVINLPEGTEIINKAEIYFDANPPVITNTTMNTYRTIPYPDPSFVYESSCSNSKALNFIYNGQTPDSAIFVWNFGNDATPSISYEQNPQNIVFGNFGIHFVSLTLTRFGCTEIITDSLTISDFSCAQNKILICHNNKVICVSNNAVPAHLAHGDCIGPCGNLNKKLSVSENNINYYFDQSNNSLNILDANQLYTIEIFDITGKCIFNNIYNSTETQEINLGYLSPGLYFAKLNSADKQISFKIVKSQ